MRKRFLRLPLLLLVFFLIGFLYYQYIVNFSGDGKKTPEEALPTDHEYVWIKGPKNDSEIRYFFLADDNYFGTGVVKKNKKGWSRGDGYFSELPKPIEENKIQSAYSDQKIIFGIIKKKGDITIKVNDKTAKLQSLESVSKDILKLYDVENCYFWYVNMQDFSEKQRLHIQVIGENGTILSELSI